MPRERKVATEAEAPAQEGKQGETKAPAYCYPSAFYEASGIPYCQKCGAPNPVDEKNNPLCPIVATDCPRLT